jgi:transposase
MKKILKQALGIDVAQKELVVSLGCMCENLSIEIYAHKVFPNTKNGFSTLVSWVQKRVDPNIKVRYVMEATGVYHESLAYYLAQEECEVSIVLPNKISNYFRTLEVKTVTDKTASETIARFGLERKLDLWRRPKLVFKKLRQ